MKLNFDPPNVEIPKGDGFCLDIGCGSGKYRKSIEEAGYNWIGVDLPTSHGDGKIVVGDAHLLPFRSGEFKLVWMSCVVEHLYNPWVALSELHRVLDSSGVILGVSGYLDPDSTHMCAFTEKGLRQVLNDIGFTHIDISPGTICFPIILRKFFYYFFRRHMKNPLDRSERIARLISRIFIISFYKVYYIVGLLHSIITNRNIKSWERRFKELNHTISRDFAAYHIYLGIKK